jgi:general secretion pathway protein G
MSNDKRMHAPRTRGFTLIELLIVMVIIGLLAALVGPKLFGQLEGAKSKAAKTQIEMVAVALDAYRLDMNAYPGTEQGIKVLWDKPDASTKNAANWRGPYLRKAVPDDPWGNPYQYKAPGAKGDYDLISLGRDGREGGEGEDADVTN